MFVCCWVGKADVVHRAPVQFLSAINESPEIVAVDIIQLLAIAGSLGKGLFHQAPRGYDAALCQKQTKMLILC